ncbi:MAG: hypothetical protein R3B13_00720 [Polyangiaceae bacterium]
MTLSRWLLVPALACLSCGHSEELGPLKDPPPAPAAGNAIPVGPLGGKLLDEPFTVHAARYYVDQRPGYEKVDIKLYSEKSETACGPLANSKSPSVWLRRKGAEALAPGTFSINLEGGGPWEAHYQTRHDERWVGYGEANALFVITAVDPDLKVHGELSACFRDPKGSCVAGRFTASYCRISIDAPVRGTEMMERRPKKPIPPPPRVRDAGADGEAP